MIENNIVNNENYVILDACIKCHNITSYTEFTGVVRLSSTRQQYIRCKDIRFEDCFAFELFCLLTEEHFKLLMVFRNDFSQTS